jgi:hypothetical protein
LAEEIKVIPKKDSETSLEKSDILPFIGQQQIPFVAEIDAETNPYAIVFKDKYHIFWSQNNNLWHIHLSRFGWSPANPILDDTNKPMVGSPCAIEFISDNLLYVFFSVIISEEPVVQVSIYYTTYDGQTWTPSQPVPRTALQATSPTVTLYKGDLWLFWNATDSSIYYSIGSQSNGNISWSSSPQPALNNIVIQGSPSAAVFNSDLYLFWNGSDTQNQPIMYASSSGGTMWSPQPVPEAGIYTETSPAATVRKSDLWLFWNGSGNNGIWYSRYDGKLWSPQQSLNNQIVMGLQGSPAAGTFRDTIFLLWNGIGSSGIFETYTVRESE